MKWITVLAKIAVVLLLIFGIGYLLTYFTAPVPVIIGVGIVAGTIFGWLQFNEMRKLPWNSGRGIVVILLALLGLLQMASQFRYLTKPPMFRPDNSSIFVIMLLSTWWLVNAFLYFIYPGIRRKQGEGMG